ncbi:MAG: hypothetical protein M3282_02805, partial [Gemmatimonadota bacterium]|nr:hypothetical protein [Gemmatimonadota bacterium]
ALWCARAALLQDGRNISTLLSATRGAIANVNRPSRPVGSGQIAHDSRRRAALTLQGDGLMPLAQGLVQQSAQWRRNSVCFVTQT